MSIEMIGEVWEHSKQRDAGLLAMLGIAYFCNREGYGWCSMTELAGRARVSRRRMVDVIKKAKHAGEIAVIHRANAAQQIANLYVILINLSPEQKKARLQAAIASVKGVVKSPRRVVKRASPPLVQPQHYPVTPASPPSEVGITGGSEIATSHDPSFIGPDPSIKDSPPAGGNGHGPKATTGKIFQLTEWTRLVLDGSFGLTFDPSLTELADLPRKVQKRVFTILQNVNSVKGTYDELKAVYNAHPPDLHRIESPDTLVLRITQLRSNVRPPDADSGPARVRLGVNS